jgi:hypothetical protein
LANKSALTALLERGEMLRREEKNCGKERIVRLMNQRHLRPVQKRRSSENNPGAGHEHPIAVNRLKGLGNLSGQRFRESDPVADCQRELLSRTH